MSGIDRSMDVITLIGHTHDSSWVAQEKEDSINLT